MDCNVFRLRAKLTFHRKPADFSQTVFFGELVFFRGMITDEVGVASGAKLRTNAMTCFRSFLSILTLTVLLFVGPLLLTVEAVAQDEVLSQATISEYTAKLTHARNIEVEVAHRVECIEARDAELASRRIALEKALGDLLRHKLDLDSEIAKQQEKQKGFSVTYESELANSARLQWELVNLQAQQQAQDADLRDCRSKWYTLPGMCQLSNWLLHTVGAIESVEGKIASSQRGLQIAKAGLNSVGLWLEQSQNELSLAQSQLVEVKTLIDQTEDDIQKLKTTLSDLRTEDQSYRKLLDDFANALKEAKSVDTADARARTARKIIRISDDVDAAVARVIDPANSVLPEGWRQNCSPR